MSQNTFQHESSRRVSELPSGRDLAGRITATVREQQPFDSELHAVVLSAVADRLSWLSTPDVLALRAQLSVDVDDQAPLADRVETIVDAILAKLEHWKRGETR